MAVKRRKSMKNKRKNRKHRGGIGVSGSAPNPCPTPGACNPTMLYKTIRGGSKNNALPYNAKSMPWGGQMAAFPPGANAMYKPGMNNLDAKFYGKLENPFLPDPATSNKALGGGRKTKRHRRKHKKSKKTRKSRKAKKHMRKTKRRHGKKHRGKKRHSKRHRSRRRRGGSMSQLLANNMPGFSDLRDLYWKAGEKTQDLYNTYKGRPAVDNTSAGVQPIGKGMKVQRPSMVSIPANLKDGSDKASQFTPY